MRRNSSHRGRGQGGFGRSRGDRPNDRRVPLNDTKSCGYCLKTGYLQNNCFLKRKADEGRRERIKRQGPKGPESQEHSTSVSLADSHAFMTKRESNGYGPGDWFIDSGATDYMSNEQGDFFFLKRLDPTVRVVLGDNTAVYAYGIGSIYLNPKIQLIGVLYVPDLGTRLLSVSAVTPLGYQVIFDHSGCKIWKDNINVLSASPQGNLFSINLHYAKISQVALTGTTPKGSDESSRKKKSKTDNMVPAKSSTKQQGHDLQLWHQRLGHLNISNVRRLAELATGLRINQTSLPLSPCPACLQGKQQRSFNRKNTLSLTRKKLGLVHSDSCGPFPVSSIAGARYFILYIDDHTRMAWCYFLKQKSAPEVLEIFTEFKVLVEKHSGELILRFRSHNGRGEYDNQLFQGYLTSEGITYELSTPYTQHQNGLSERMIRTVMERARTILLESKLQDRFWAEAVNISVYLHNRSPTRALHGATPYEALHGTIPQLQHLRRFGCDAHA